MGDRIMFVFPTQINPKINCYGLSTKTLFKQTLITHGPEKSGSHLFNKNLTSQHLGTVRDWRMANCWDRNFALVSDRKKPSLIEDEIASGTNFIAFNGHFEEENAENYAI